LQKNIILLLTKSTTKIRVAYKIIYVNYIQSCGVQFYSIFSTLVYNRKDKFPFVLGSPAEINGTLSRNRETCQHWNS
jgi:hypothetical protein